MNLFVCKNNLHIGLAMEHRHAFGKLFKGWPTCGYFGQNLGSLNINVMISYMLFKPQKRIPAE
jgi:hypothetical protein